MNDKELLNEIEFGALEENADYVFKGGLYEGKLLLDPKPAFIYITNDNAIIVIMQVNNGYRLMRKESLKSIKRATSGQGTVTISLGPKKQPINLLLDSAERGNFISYFGDLAKNINKSQEMDTEITKVQSPEEIEKELEANNDTLDIYATELFVKVLKSKGVKEASSNAGCLDIFMGIVITASLMLIPILKGWTVLVIILAIAIVYVRNNYY